jgi:hypothetical protein
MRHEGRIPIIHWVQLVDPRDLIPDFRSELK